MLTTIANEEAPTSFSYEVTLDPGQTLELDALEGVAYPVVADPIWFPTAIAAAFGRGAVARIFDR